MSALGSFPCPVCQRVFPSRGSLDTHREWEQHWGESAEVLAFPGSGPTLSIRCAECRELFLTPGELAAHRAQRHPWAATFACPRVRVGLDFSDETPLSLPDRALLRRGLSAAPFPVGKTPGLRPAEISTPRAFHLPTQAESPSKRAPVVRIAGRATGCGARGSAPRPVEGGTRGVA